MKFNTTVMVIGGVIVIGLLFLLGYIAISSKAPGPLIAGLLGGFGTWKSKIFGSSKEEIKTEHTAKREGWALIKEDHDNELRALKAKVDYLDYRSAKISMQINDLDKEELDILTKLGNLTDEELLRYANDLNMKTSS